MKKLFIGFLLAATVVLSFSACSPSPLQEADSVVGALTKIYKEEAKTENMDAYMKLSKQLNLTTDETYSIKLPFDCESVSYQSDNPLIAAVDKNGLICRKCAISIFASTLSSAITKSITIRSA